MIRLAIIFGGKSIEHERSLKSAVSVLNAIDREKYEIIKIGITKEGKWLLYDGPVEFISTGEWKDYAELKLLAEPEKYNLQIISSSKSLKSIADVAFPVLHGPDGEDGAVQGVLQTVGIPYVGSRVLGSAVSMDKATTKALLKQAGLPVCDWKIYYKEEIEDNSARVIADIEDNFSYPVFVKPSGYGASIGVSKAGDRETLKKALADAYEFDRKVIVEKYIDCREIEVGILGNIIPMASAAGEISYPGEFCDFNTKFSPESGIKRTVPAEIPADTAARAKQLAIDASWAVDLKGFGRVDFFLEKGTGELYINEINSIPAFADECIFIKLWEAAGLSYTDLLDRLVGYALEK